MKDYDNLVKKVKDLLRKNDTKKALEILANEHLSSIDKDLIILTSRYTKIKEDQRLGIVDPDDAERRLNSVKVGVIGLFDLMKNDPQFIEVEEAPAEEKAKTTSVPVKKIEKKQQPKDVSNKKTASKSSTKKYILIGGSILLIALAAVWGIMQSNKKAAIAAEQKEQKQKLVDAENEKKAQVKRDALERKKNIVLGNKFQGGIIFYIDNTGEHGLIMAQGDQSTTEINWLEKPLEKAGAYDSGIYAGKENTKKIAEKFGPGKYPARLCYDLEWEGYSDWYLPSQDELDLLWEYTAEKRIHSRVVNHKGFSQKYYWSSTELNDKDVYYRSFFDSGKYYYIKRNKAKVRAIRSF